LDSPRISTTSSLRDFAPIAGNSREDLIAYT
jgi:hypothetical protein